MKYRVQFEGVFNNTDANAILNHIESIKTDVFKATQYTEVSIIRKAIKTDYDGQLLSPGNEYASVDFDIAQATHSGDPTGVVEFYVGVDVSFTVQQDEFDLLNYLESIKANALTGSGNDYLRFGRHFDCRHDQSPLINDGSYTFMDFDGAPLTY